MKTNKIIKSAIMIFIGWGIASLTFLVSLNKFFKNTILLLLEVFTSDISWGDLITRIKMFGAFLILVISLFVVVLSYVLANVEKVAEGNEINLYKVCYEVYEDSKKFLSKHILTKITNYLRTKISSQKERNEVLAELKTKLYLHFKAIVKWRSSLMLSKTVHALKKNYDGLLKSVMSECKLTTINLYSY